MAANYIEEYLVKLGADVDARSVAELKKAVNSVHQMVGGMESLDPKLTKASALVTAAISGIVASGVSLVKSMGDQEMAYETLGRTMFVSAGQAKQMKMALDALGKSANEVQINPKLREQYRQLLSDSAAMTAGGGYKAAMNQVQELAFEFTRLKQEIAAGMQWVAYYIVKDLAKPLGDAKKTLKTINNYIITNLPRITRTIATGFGFVRNIAFAVWRVLSGIGKRINEFWKRLPHNGRVAFLALGTAIAAFLAGPIGAMAMAIGGVLLLLDDYFAYMDGKKSLFGEQWEKLNSVLELCNKAWSIMVDYVSRFFHWVEHSERLQAFVNAFERMAKAIYNIAEYLGEGFFEKLSELWTYIVDTETVNAFSEAFDSLGQGVTSLVNGISSLIDGILKFFKISDGITSKTRAWTSFKKVLKQIVITIAKMISGIGKFANIIGKLLTGDFAGAKALIGNMFSGGVDLSDKRLGALSSKYEGAPGTTGGSGGAYGSWQIIPDNIPDFLQHLSGINTEWYNRLSNAGAVGSADFDQEWRDIASEDPEGFREAQRQYIAKTHYAPQVAQILNSTGLNIEKQSRGVREAVWSVAVQHGGGTNIIERAIQAMGGASAINMSAESQKALIDAIYNVRNGYTANSEGVTAEQLHDRWDSERADAKAIIQQEADEWARNNPPPPQEPDVTPSGSPSLLERAANTGRVLENGWNAVKQKWGEWTGTISNLAGTSSFADSRSSRNTVNAPVTINVYGNNADPQAIGRAAASEIRKVLPERDICNIYDRGAGMQ